MLDVKIKHQLDYYKLEVAFQISNEIVVLFGPSGAGKTTILNGISGLIKLDAASIQLHERQLNEHHKRLVQVQNREIAYVFQNYALFPHRTVWQNIAYGMKKQKTAEQIAKSLAITHLFQKYPHEISGGERQRTAIARALASEPKLLLLDEPFSALDEATKLRSYDQLLALHRIWRIPIILVTHNKLDAEKLADRILYIDKGSLVSEQKLK